MTVLIDSRWHLACLARVFRYLPAEEIIRLFHISRARIKRAILNPVPIGMDRGPYILRRFNIAKRVLKR